MNDMISKFYQSINIIMCNYQLYFTFIFSADSFYSVLIINNFLLLYHIDYYTFILRNL